MNITEKALAKNDIDRLKALRQAGKLDWSAMSTLAIYKRMDMLQMIYQWTLEDNVKEVKVPAYTESIDAYMTRVLEYLARELLQTEHNDFFNLVRQTKKLNYNHIITYVLHECRQENLFQILDTLIRYAKEDGFELDYQRFLEGTLGQCRSYGDDIDTTPEYLRKQAQKVNYTVNWSKLTGFEDLRQVIKWAKEDNQTLVLDFQQLLERVSPYHPNPELIEFYIKGASNETQSIDWAKLLDLFQNHEEIIERIKKHIPNDYKMPTYEESIDIDISNLVVRAKPKPSDSDDDSDDDSNERIISDLGHFAMKTTEIEYVTYKGKKYYMRGNSLNNGPDERPDYDPDVECGMHDGYMDGCEAPPEIYPENDADVEFHLKYNPKNVVWNEDSFSQESQKLIRKIQHTPVEKVRLTASADGAVSVLVMRNPSGINTDHRGCDHCKVHLAFHSDYSLPLPCTLMDFMKAMYRIKSHKWDYWYELYGGATVKSCKKGIMKVDFSFDHGS